MKGACSGKIKTPKKWSPENQIFNKCSKRNLLATKIKIQSLAFPLQVDLKLVTVVCNLFCSRTPSGFDTALPTKRERAKLLSVVKFMFIGPCIIVIDEE